MSADYAILSAHFETSAEALVLADALDSEVDGDPPPGIDDLIAELERIDAIDEDNGFLSMWPIDAGAGGAIVCTRYDRSQQALSSFLAMTRDRRLALVDRQSRLVFDPRHHVRVEVSLANGAQLPYLTEQIVHDVMERQDFYGDYLVAERRPEHFVQALYERGQPCYVEYRAGGPDQHFQTQTTDRALVVRLIGSWLTHGPQADLLMSQRWQRVQL